MVLTDPELLPTSSRLQFPNVPIQKEYSLTGSYASATTSQDWTFPGRCEVYGYHFPTRNGLSSNVYQAFRVIEHPAFPNRLTVPAFVSKMETRLSCDAQPNGGLSHPVGQTLACCLFHLRGQAYDLLV